jgi:hypothetical protein
LAVRRLIMQRTHLYLIGAVSAVFIVIAIGGSVYVTNGMNKAADEHGLSAGRDGDARPNGAQEFQNDKAARGPSATTGSKTEGAVPPASR